MGGQEIPVSDNTKIFYKRTDDGYSLFLKYGDRYTAKKKYLTIFAYLAIIGVVTVFLIRKK